MFAKLSDLLDQRSNIILHSLLVNYGWAEIKIKRNKSTFCDCRRLPFNLVYEYLNSIPFNDSLSNAFQVIHPDAYSEHRKTSKRKVLRKYLYRLEVFKRQTHKWCLPILYGWHLKI